MTSEQNFPRLLTVREVMERCRWSRRTVAYKVARGELRHYRDGHILRIYEDSLMQHLEARTIESRQTPRRDAKTAVVAADTGKFLERPPSEWGKEAA